MGNGMLSSSEGKMKGVQKTFVPEKPSTSQQRQEFSAPSPLQPSALPVLSVGKWWSVKTIRVYSLVANVPAEVEAEMFSKTITKQNEASSSFVSLSVIPREEWN